MLIPTPKFSCLGRFDPLNIIFIICKRDLAEVISGSLHIQDIFQLTTKDRHINVDLLKPLNVGEIIDIISKKSRAKVIESFFLQKTTEMISRLTSRCLLRDSNMTPNYNTVYTVYLEEIIISQRHCLAGATLRLHIPLKCFTVTMCGTTDVVYMDERVHTLSSNATCYSLA